VAPLQAEFVPVLPRLECPIVANARAWSGSWLGCSGLGSSKAAGPAVQPGSARNLAAMTQQDTDTTTAVVATAVVDSTTSRKVRDSLQRQQGALPRLRATAATPLAALTHQRGCKVLEQHAPSPRMAKMPGVTEDTE
jgi:hypothetical protein